MKSSITRIEYNQPALIDDEMLSDPIAQLQKWWDEAIRENVHLVDAVHLSTVDENNRPNARIVLLKSFDDDGLVFYTNYQSAKARELDHNPHAAMVIFWPQVERQIRIRGETKKTSREISENYFRTRPRGAQLGAWASHQSNTITDRNDLEQRYKNLAAEYESDEVPCPPFWGGFRLSPEYFEFWQGRTNRLHDRVCYTRTSEGGWARGLLSP